MKYIMEINLEIDLLSLKEVEYIYIYIYTFQKLYIIRTKEYFKNEVLIFFFERWLN